MERANYRGIRMKKLTQDQINKILEEHRHWINEDCEGWETMRADFSYCDLNHAILGYADLNHAKLRSAKEVRYIPMVCPEEGDFIGWKKAGGKIVKLRIPEDALCSSATTRKCRCNKAEVIEIYNIDGTIAGERIVNSSYDSSFTYEVGKTVEVQDFDTNRWEECTKGIHFFINRQEAINY